MQLTTTNNTYNLYKGNKENITYIQKTSNMSNNYIGEAVINKPIKSITLEDCINKRYQ